MGYLVKTADGPLVDGRRFYTPSTSPNGSGDQTSGFQDALDYAADTEIKGLWMGRGTIVWSDQPLLRNMTAFRLVGAGAQNTGMGNSGSSPPVRSTGTRILWKGAATKAALGMSDCRSCIIEHFGIHVSPTEFELLGAIDCYPNSVDNVVVPSANVFQHLSFNGVNAVGGHSQFHYGIRFASNNSYLAPTNATNGNGDFNVARDIEANCLQVIFSIDGDQSKNNVLQNIRAYGVSWDPLTETDTSMKQQCVIAVGAIYNPAANTWSSPAAGGNFHAKNISGSRSAVGDVVFGQAGMDASTWDGGNIEGSARMVARCPGVAAVNLVWPFDIDGVRWSHAGRIATDKAFIDMHWAGPLTLRGCTIDDDKDVTPTAPGSGVATGVGNPLHILAEPPSTYPAVVRLDGNHIASTTLDLVRTKGANPRRIAVSHVGNIRRNRNDDSYLIYPNRPFDRKFSYYEYDDFDNQMNTSGSVGKMGWSVSSPTHVVAPSTITDHPGIVQLTTTATSGTFAWMRLSQGSGATLRLPSMMFELTWIFLLGTNDANTTFRAGLLTGTTAAPAGGVYLEKTDSDTNWFFNCRSAGVETRVDSGVAVNTSYHRLRIRRIDATTIGFTLDNGTEVTIATNVPTALLYDAIQIVNSAAAAKTFNADFWDYGITGLVR